MKKTLLILSLLVSSMTSKAFVWDVMEWTVGAQMVYGTEGNMPGAGLHFKTHYLEDWRTVLSGNYYFKKNGLSCYDVNIEGNYIFNIGEKIQLYPLLGGRVAIWHVDDVNVDVWHFDNSDNSHYEIGLNAGGGIDYLLGEHWLVNAEVKYQYIKDADQVLFSVGLGYRF
jgi:outer membrane protein X